MISHDDMLRFQSEKHPIINVASFSSLEEYCLHIIHCKAYEEAAKKARGRKVLDYGCNIGYGTNILSKYCNYIIGVDISPKAIEKAKKLYRSDNIQFELIDGKKLPFRDSMFDLIVSYQVIEHIVDYESYFSEIKRTILPDGEFLLTTPNGKLRLDPGMKPWNPYHVREFTHFELKELLAMYFKNVKIYGLLAEEPIYSVEFNRILRARNTARKQQKGIGRYYFLLRNVAKNKLPNSIYFIIKMMYDKINCNKIKPFTFNYDILLEYSPDKLFYSEKEIDKALDLMAICKL